MQVYDTFDLHPLCNDPTGLQGDKPLDIFDFHTRPLNSDTTEKSTIAIIPHIEVPGCSTSTFSWVDPYRASVIQAIRDALGQLEEKATILIGIKDFRITIEPENTPFSSDIVFDMEMLSLIDQTRISKPTRYVPLSMLVLEDIRSAFENELTIKEFFVVAPIGYHCRSNESTENLKVKIRSETLQWKNELLLDEQGHIGHRQLLPIVHANYFVFETKREKR
jgi:hypothetical protein